MLRLEAPADMRAACRERASSGARVGFVPTMGALHEGHLSLLREAARRSHVVAMSVFVNPLQFSPTEDFATYPRDIERDASLAADAGVDILWSPTAEQMYPEPPAVTVAPGPVGSTLEGAARPGHFAGVLTVVLKLFSVVRPDVAVFGRKDAQQAYLVRRMISDFDLPVELVVAPTVRDTDGLALSSRNSYLDAAERDAALALPRSLEAGVRTFRSGERRAGRVVAAAYEVLAAAERSSGVTTEYVNVLDSTTFSPSHAATGTSYLAAAVRVGERRLLDNVVLGDGLEADPRLGGEAASRAAV